MRPSSWELSAQCTFVVCTLNQSSSRSLSQEQNFCIEAARRSANICLAAPRAQARLKQDATPVSAADFAIQLTVARLLRKTFPHDFLVGEEDESLLHGASDICQGLNELLDFQLRDEIPFFGNTSHSESSRCWVLDPIDGTKGFLGSKGYAIGLALLPPLNDSHPGSFPQVSILALPREQIALLSQRTPNSTQMIHLDESPSLQRKTFGQFRRSGADMCCSPAQTGPWLFSGVDDLVLPGRPTWSPLCCGSLIKYAAVARGQAIGLVQVLESNGEAHVWDHAAGIGVVVGSGGMVTDADGIPLQIGSDTSRRLIRVVGDTKAVVATARGVDHLKFCAEVKSALQRNRGQRKL